MTMIDQDKPLPERLKVAFDRVAGFPENRMAPGAVAKIGSGFTDLLALRNLVPEAITELQTAHHRIAVQTAAMEKAAALFQWYADEHTAAGKAEKAARNQAAANDLRAAIQDLSFGARLSARR